MRFFLLIKHTGHVIVCLEVHVMRTIPEKETLTIEFKSDRSGYSDADLVDEIVGMANTQGGDLCWCYGTDRK